MSNPFLKPTNDTNPYAAPLTTAPPRKGSGGPNSGVWRSGNQLVVAVGADLPPICVKTGQPATEFIFRRFSWNHPALVLLLILNVLLYIIVALIVTKRRALSVPITEEVREKRFKHLLICWTLGLGMVGLFIVAFVLLLNTNQADSVSMILGVTMLVAVIAALATLVIGSRVAGILRPTRITKEFAWFKGASPDYLNQLPNWTG